MRGNILLLLLIVVALSACGESESNVTDDAADDAVIAELRAIERQVMEVHDEVMPKMGELNNTRKKLELASESESQYAESIETAIAHLNEADSLMWDWMHNYQRPDYEADLDIARTYLENEMKRVEVMKEKMLSSIDDGSALLQKLEQDEG